MTLASLFRSAVSLKIQLFRCSICPLLVLAGLNAPGWCSAAEPEVVERHVREFRVSVDGKPRGTQTMTISRHSDRSEVMQGEAEVLMNFVVYRYRYSSNGTETWKDGRLIRLTNEADYNGDKYVIKGSATEQALHYEVNDVAHKAPSDILVASYWKEPDAKRVGRQVRLLDSDKGNQFQATVSRVGSETVTIDTREIPTTHYRFRGDVQVDVWYDRDGFVTRQESLESGHRTLLELTKIRRQ